MRKYGKRYFISLLASSIVMYGLSYCWHGLFLNDYQLIQYPLGIFLAAAAVAYLMIGALLGRLFIAPQLDRVSRHPLLRGPVAGVLTGVAVYVLALVIGVTYNKELDLKFIVMDVVWQAIEQAIGGFVTGLVYMFVYEPFYIPQEAEHQDDLP